MDAPTSSPPAAIQFGAGKIGRGLMGELFFASGYRTVFVDIDRPLVKALQRVSSYEVHHVTNAGDKPVHVAGFSALDAADVEAVAEAIVDARIVCTAVAHAAFIRSLAGVRAHVAGVVTALEPVYGIVFAAVLLGEIPSPRTIGGGLIILSVAVGVSRKSGSRISK